MPANLRCTFYCFFVLLFDYVMHLRSWCSRRTTNTSMMIVNCLAYTKIKDKHIFTSNSGHNKNSLSMNISTMLPLSNLKLFLFSSFTVLSTSILRKDYQCLMTVAIHALQLFGYIMQNKQLLNDQIVQK